MIGTVRQAKSDNGGVSVTDDVVAGDAISDVEVFVPGEFNGWDPVACVPVIGAGVPADSAGVRTF